MLEKAVDGSSEDLSPWIMGRHLSCDGPRRFGAQSRVGEGKLMASLWRRGVYVLVVIRLDIAGSASVSILTSLIPKSESIFNTCDLCPDSARFNGCHRSNSGLLKSMGQERRLHSWWNGVRGRTEANGASLLMARLSGDAGAGQSH